MRFSARFVAVIAAIVLALLVAGAPVFAQAPPKRVDIYVNDDGIFVVSVFPEAVTTGDSAFVHVTGSFGFAGAGVSFRDVAPVVWTVTEPPTGPLDVFWTIDGPPVPESIRVVLGLSPDGGVTSVTAVYPPELFDPTAVAAGEAGWSATGEGFVTGLPVVVHDGPPPPVPDAVSVEVDTGGETYGSASAEPTVAAATTTSTTATTTATTTTGSGATEVTTAGASEEAPSAVAETGGGLPLGVWVLLGGVIVLAAMFFVVRARGVAGGGLRTASGTGGIDIDYQPASPLDGPADPMLPEGWSEPLDREGASPDEPG